MFTKTFWNYGLCLHLGFVSFIATSAYLGILPTTYKMFPHIDLLGHFVLIGLLAFFLDGVLNFRLLIPGKLSFLRAAPVFVLGIVAFEEYAQSFSPLRTASFVDFLADALGIFFFSAFAKYLTERSLLTNTSES